VRLVVTLKDKVWTIHGLMAALGWCNLSHLLTLGQGEEFLTVRTRVVSAIQ